MPNNLIPDGFYSPEELEVLHGTDQEGRPPC